MNTSEDLYDYDTFIAEDPNNITGKIGAGFVIVFIVSGVIGNTLVLVAIVCTRSLQKTYNMYIAGLAVSDLLMNVVIMPFYAHPFLYKQWAFSTLLCNFNTYFGTILLCSSPMHIGCIALNRYMLIVHPQKKYIMLGKKTVVVKMVVIWIVCFLIVLPGMLGHWAKIGYTHQTGRCNYLRTASRATLEIVFIVGFIFPYAVMIYCYLRITYKIRKSELRLQRCKSTARIKRLSYDDKRVWGIFTMSADNGCESSIQENLPSEENLPNSRLSRLNQEEGDKPLNSNNKNVPISEINIADSNKRAENQTENKNNTQTYKNYRFFQGFKIFSNQNFTINSVRYQTQMNNDRTLRMLTVLFLNYLLTYMPFTIINIIDINGTFPRSAYIVSAVVCWSSTCINPWIYGIMSLRFRKAYADILWRICWRHCQQNKAKQHSHMFD